jgi:hypothetical protein
VQQQVLQVTVGRYVIDIAAEIRIISEKINSEMKKNLLD